MKHTTCTDGGMPEVLTFRGDQLAPILRTILDHLDQLATATRTLRGTCSRLDSARDDLHDLLAEVSQGKCPPCNQACNQGRDCPARKAGQGIAT